MRSIGGSGGNDDVVLFLLMGNGFDLSQVASMRAGVSGGRWLVAGGSLKRPGRASKKTRGWFHLGERRVGSSISSLDCSNCRM